MINQKITNNTTMTDKIKTNNVTMTNQKITNNITMGHDNPKYDQDEQTNKSAAGLEGYGGKGMRDHSGKLCYPPETDQPYNPCFGCKYFARRHYGEPWLGLCELTVEVKDGRISRCPDYG